MSNSNRTRHLYSSSSPIAAGKEKWNAISDDDDDNYDKYLPPPPPPPSPSSNSPTPRREWNKPFFLPPPERLCLKTRATRGLFGVRIGATRRSVFGQAGQRSQWGFGNQWGQGNPWFQGNYLGQRTQWYQRIERGQGASGRRERPGSRGRKRGQGMIQACQLTLTSRSKLKNTTKVPPKSGGKPTGSKQSSAKPSAPEVCCVKSTPTNPHTTKLAHSRSSSSKPSSSRPSSSRPSSSRPSSSRPSSSRPSSSRPSSARPSSSRPSSGNPLNRSPVRAPQPSGRSSSAKAPPADQKKKRGTKASTPKRESR